MNELSKLDKLKIYFDSCCFSRPFDDQNQIKIYNESESIISIIRIMRRNNYILFGSEISFLEINEMVNTEKRNRTLALYSFVDYEIMLNDHIVNRAKYIASISNIKLFDSLHLACAECGKTDVFLTTDDRLIRQSSKLSLRMKILNPIQFLQEIGNV